MVFLSMILAFSVPILMPEKTLSLEMALMPIMQKIPAIPIATISRSSLMRMRPIQSRAIVMAPIKNILELLPFMHRAVLMTVGA